MTLQELFEYFSDRPRLVLGYFILVPLLALAAGALDKDRGHYLPWNYIYAVLIYLVCIPGIFAFTLNIYLFLFEKRNIMATDLYTQVLPIVSMVITLWIIRKNVYLDYIPGFDRLSGLIMLITAALAIMWLVDRFRVIAFTQIRFQYVILFLLGLIFVMRYGVKSILGSPNRSQK